MNFSDFLTAIPKIEAATLLGEEAHGIMSPPERMALLEMLGEKIQQGKKAAVMMLFYPRNKQTHIVLIIRNAYPGVHSSQIAFPGGKVDVEDISFSETALRETEEEIGINRNRITIVRAFSELYIPPSNFLVYPFLGYCNEELFFEPNPEEVAGLIEMPLQDLLNDNNAITYKMVHDYNVPGKRPVFKFEEHRIWGATAMILSELKETLKKVF